MVWYQDPAMVVAVVISCIGFGYLIYRLLKELWDRL